MMTIKRIETPLNVKFGTLFRIFYEPSEIFSHPGLSRNAWLPIVLLIASSALLSFWYYQFVDFEWLQDYALSNIKDPKEQEAIKSMSMSQQTTSIAVATGAAVTMLLSFVLSGFYFMIVGKIRNAELTFSRGFSLAAWAATPHLLLFPLGALQILISSNDQIAFEALNPLSLNQLFIRLEVAHPLAGLFESLSATTFWNIALIIIGYRVCANTTLAVATRVGLFPYAIVYGIWFVVALIRTA